MSLVKSILKRIGTTDIKVLGRWKIETCDKKMNNKIDLSNEDHCGPCGQYILNKTYSYHDVSKNINTNNTNINKRL